MNEKQARRFMLALVCLIASIYAGCASAPAGQPAGTGAVAYIKPEDSASAKYATAERLAGLEQQIRDAQDANDTLKADNQRLADDLDKLTGDYNRASGIIGELTESCPAIINAGGRHESTLQESLDQAQSLYNWVVYAWGLLHNFTTAQTPEGEVGAVGQIGE
jgi:ABC-type transporter Mla subunit MlaD